MFHNRRTPFVSSVAAFATATMALWCGLGQPLAAHGAPAPVDASKPVAYPYVARALAAETTYSNAPTIAAKSVVNPGPPISCKVGTKGVLTDCRINDGYNLNDVANWFQDDHDRTLQVAVNSVTLARRFEHSFESCIDKK